MDQEIKKQVLIDFVHRCSICGKSCSFEQAHFAPWKKVESPKAKDLICLCPECNELVSREGWDTNKLIKYKAPSRIRKLVRYIISFWVKHKILFWIQRDNKKSITELLPRNTVVITLRQENASFSKIDRKLLQSAISAFLDIDKRTVQIKSTKGNPIEIPIELPAINAEMLLKSFIDKDSQLKKFLSPLSFSLIKQKNAEMRWFTDEELMALRDDYRELEKEIQNFFRAYYLSGLILVAAWLIGQSKPFIELSIGNGGYNIYALLGIAFLNMTAMTYLLHKSIAVHEITQFITYLSKPDSIFNYWESWRRSPQNYSKKAHPFYYIMVTALPLFVSLLILCHVYYILKANTYDLLTEVKQQQIPQISTINNPNAPILYDGMPDIEHKKLKIAEEQFRKEQEAYGVRVKSVFAWAWIFFLIISIAHVIPILLILINSWKQKQKWEKINKLRGWGILFQDLTVNPTINDVPLNKNETIIHTADANKSTYEFTETELKLFIKRIKEESNKNI